MTAPGGRIAGYVIHTPDGLSRAERLRAAELGPSDVNASAGPAAMTREAGFKDTLVRDVTAEFRATCWSLLQAREAHADELKGEEGEEAFQEELGKKARMLEGIEAGLLRRSLVAAVKPEVGRAPSRSQQS